MAHTTTEPGRKSMTRQTATRRNSPRQATAPDAMDGGTDRQEMIAVAAYYRAEHRGFDGGDPVADWLAAETEIDAALKNTRNIVVH